MVQGRGMTDDVEALFDALDFIRIHIVWV